MNPNHLAVLRKDFRLGDVVSIAESTEGVLNRNYILETSVGKFFIKQVRDKAKDRLPATALVEELMRERGIPAVCMCATKDAEKFAVYDGVAYSVYPFIESDRSHKYSLADYRNMGILLGEIHRAGSQNIPDTLTKRRLKVTPKDDIAKELVEYKARIQEMRHTEKIDEEFLAYIDLKRALIPEVDLGTSLANETLTHGDYHAGNLLIDKKRRNIIEVCDWEKACMAPRAYELGRAILYISFSEGYAEPSGRESACEVISGYTSVCPMSRDEIREGLRARLHHSVCSVWLERHHYELKDPRVDHFVAHEIQLIRDFIHGDFASRLI
ncbi:phosphotransferase [Candidatus Kaiserbacteria bacterium]|nr:phosphotransferase [Candidatus Kaiserbacteria bacterium]